MTERANEARKAYRREWQRKNRDKINQYMERYWLRKADEADRAAAEAAKAASSGTKV